MSRPKCAENDPWSPLPAASGVIQQPPADPRYQLIDSGRYIESLEKKLNRIKGKQKQEPSSRDIIDSLALFRDDQMRRYIEKEEQVTTSPTITQDQDNTSATSYIQRKLHPERQAINVEELFELLKDDQLARVRAEENGEEDDDDDVKEQPVSSGLENAQKLKQGSHPQGAPAESKDDANDKSSDADVKETDSAEGDR